MFRAGARYDRDAMKISSRDAVQKRIQQGFIGSARALICIKSWDMFHSVTLSQKRRSSSHKTIEVASANRNDFLFFGISRIHFSRPNINVVVRKTRVTHCLIVPTNNESKPRFQYTKLKYLILLCCNFRKTLRDELQAKMFHLNLNIRQVEVGKCFFLS